MRACGVIRIIVAIHLGFTAASKHNAPETPPAGMVPSPAGYLFELLRGVAADTGTYLCICDPLLLVGPTGHLENWLGGVKRKRLAVADEGTQERHASRK